MENIDPGPGPSGRKRRDQSPQTPMAGVKRLVLAAFNSEPDRTPSNAAASASGRNHVSKTVKQLSYTPATQIRAPVPSPSPSSTQTDSDDSDRGLFVTPTAPIPKCVKCPSCGKEFGRSDNMLKHLRTPGRCKSINIVGSPNDDQVKVLQAELSDARAEIAKLRARAQSPETTPYQNVSIWQKRRRRVKLRDYARQLANDEEGADQLLRDTVATLPKRKAAKLKGKFGISIEARQKMMHRSRQNYLRSARIIFPNQRKLSRKSFRMVQFAFESIGEHNCGVKVLSYEATLSFLRREISYIRLELHPMRGLITTEQLPSVVQEGNGQWRDLKPTAVRLAHKFLNAAHQENPTVTLHWCGPELQFNLAVGADAFPYFNKSVTAFVMSILDLGSRVHSPESLALLFAADVAEGHEACTAYCSTLVAEMKELTAGPPISHTLPDGQEVQFSFQFKALVGDQSWQMKALGQGGCSSRYFSPYVNGCKAKENNDLRIPNASVGEQFEAWTYEKRMHFVEQITKFLEEYTKKNGKEPDAQTFNNFVYKLGTSQKVAPPIDWMSDFSYICTLHGGINCVKTFYRGLLFGLVYELTNFMSDSMVGCPNSPLPKTNGMKFKDLERLSLKEQQKGQLGVPFVHIVHTLRTEMRSTRVANQIEKLINDKCEDLGHFRITGEDVRMFCQHMPRLTGETLRDIVTSLTFDKKVTKHLLVIRKLLSFLHFVAILLRKIISLINKTTLTEAELEAVETLCRMYQNVTAAVSNSSAFDFHNQAVWTMSHVVPFHARKMFTELPGKGLGLVSMQGREHLHMVLKAMLRTTNYGNKWVQLHEYMETSSNFLPTEFNEVGIFYEKGGHGTRGNYQPAGAEEIPLLDIRCELENCQSCIEYRDVLMKAAESGEIVKGFGKK